MVRPNWKNQGLPNFPMTIFAQFPSAHKSRYCPARLLWKWKCLTSSKSSFARRSLPNLITSITNFTETICSDVLGTDHSEAVISFLKRLPYRSKFSRRNLGTLGCLTIQITCCKYSHCTEANELPCITRWLTTFAYSEPCCLFKQPSVLSKFYQQPVSFAPFHPVHGFFRFNSQPIITSR